MNNDPVRPLIVGFVSDLMFTTKIENAARHLGYRLQWVENATIIGEVDPEAPEETPGELLHGREGQLFEKITGWQPALLIFDLTNQAIPWRDWIAALKSSPATRRIPILCFGPHEDVEVMQTAGSVGANAVVARSRFTAGLPDLIEKHARIPDREALRQACDEPLLELAARGIEMFNQGEYYKCHDDLEVAWMEDQGPGRDLYRGILQVGIALYQVQRGNYRGAIKMLLRVRQWLEPLPDACRGIDVARLRQNAQAIYDALIALGPEQVEAFDWGIVEPVRLAPEEKDDN